VIQYLPDSHGIFHAGNDAHRALTLLTGFDVDMEHPFQSLSPTHRHMALGEAAVILILTSLLAPLAPACGCDESPVFAIGGEYPMEAGKVNSRLGHQGRQPRHKIQWLEDHMGSTVSEGRLEFVAHLAGGRKGQAPF